MKLFLIFRYSSRLEDDSFRSKSADYFMFILIVIALMVTVSFFLPIPFGTHCLVSTFIYVWTKRNPKVLVSLLGLVYFKAEYLPYLFLFVNVILKNNIVFDIFGIVFGHIYFYLYFVVPKLPCTKDVNIMAAPRFFQKFTDWLGLDSKRELILEEGDFVDDNDFIPQINPQ